MNERDIIAYLHKVSGNLDHDELVCGIGDDCAVLKKDGRSFLLVTTDTLIEGVHFDLSWHPAEKLGRKSVAVNVSDIAAMGGKPLFVFLSLGMPKGFDPGWFKEFSQGIGEACSEFNCLLAGGDTVRSLEGVIINLTVIGEIPQDQVVYRRGAQVGDTIWASGLLGSAAAGLHLLKSGVKPIDQSYLPIVEAHLNPQPRVELGLLLSKSKMINAMMDLSDGLATDLSHLCQESGVGAILKEEKLPVDPVMIEAANQLDLNPVELAITGGEDYELLFTAQPACTAEIVSLGESSGIKVSAVGTIVEEPGVRLRRLSSSKDEPEEIDVTFKGFDHFLDS